MLTSQFMQLWDMRNVMSPVKEFVGHTKGNTTGKMIYLYQLFMIISFFYFGSSSCFKDVIIYFYRIHVI